MVRCAFRARLLVTSFLLVAVSPAIAQQLKCSEETLAAVHDYDSDRCIIDSIAVVVPRCADQIRRHDVDARIEKEARRTIEYDSPHHLPHPPADFERSCRSRHIREQESSAECGAPYRIGSVLSFSCRKFWNSAVRPESAPWSLLLDISGRRLRVLSLESLLKDAPGPRARFWQLVIDDLVRQTDGEFTSSELIENAGEPARAYGAVVLNGGGISIEFDRYYLGWSTTAVVLPYAAVRDLLNCDRVPRCAP